MPRNPRNPGEFLTLGAADHRILSELTLDTLLKLPTVRDVVTCLSLRVYQ